MLLSLFAQNPMLAVVWIAVLLISLTVHEFSHALMGRQLGDTTAEAQGRLTLNPLAHIDPLGFLALLFVGFGWAKPVPYNPSALRNPARDAVLIALAGPLANIALMLAAGGVFYALVVLGALASTSLLAVFLVLLVYINGILALFNVIPLPPLDGSKIVESLLAHTRQRQLAEVFARFGPVLLFLLVFASASSNLPIFDYLSVPVLTFCQEILTTQCVDVLLTAMGL